MTEPIVHQMENNEDTQRHLQENTEKYEGDAVFLLKCMKRGEILTAQSVVEKYRIHDRRLRELFSDGKCQKRWKLNENGKRMYVEYFIDIPKQPTKKELHDDLEIWFKKYQSETPVIDIGFRQGDLFNQ